MKNQKEESIKNTKSIKEKIVNVVNNLSLAIYTPIHKFNRENLELLIKSLKLQTNKDFIWIVLLNGEVVSSKTEVTNHIEDMINDEFKYYITTDETPEHQGMVGSLKRVCVEHAKKLNPKYILELDYDDALHEDCIDEVIKAFESDVRISTVYSNFAHFDKNSPTFSMTYSPYYGWISKPHFSVLFDTELNETIAYPPLPQFLERIESAPNHLRAFRLSDYIEAGGYYDLQVGDDHDLLCRMFLLYKRKFYHIDKCLYYQRYSSDTTTHLLNDAIQKQVKINYTNYSNELYKRHLGLSKFAEIKTIEDAITIPKFYEVLVLKYEPGRPFLDDVNNNKETLTTLLTDGGRLNIVINKLIYNENIINIIKELKYQFRGWTETETHYELHFIKFSGGYAERYWGEPV